MSVRCSSRHPIPFACSLALLLVATRAPAQQPDEVLVAELARLLEAVTALAKIGGDEAARALGDLLGSGSRPGIAPPPAVSAALLEAWRLGSRAPIAALVGYAEDADAAARWHAVYALGRLRAGAGVSTLLAALRDREPFVRATALRGLTRAAADSAKLEPGRIAGAVRLLLGDADPAVRVNALRALASFRDSALAGAAASLATDPDVNVAVQAETTLGPLGGSGELLGHADAAVRSVAADLLARRPDVADVDRLVTAYQRAAGDPFDDGRLSAVAALGAVARTGAEGRLRVAARFVAAVSRPDDYLVRRVAAERLPDAAEAWGPVVPIVTGKTDAEYRDVVRRVLLPALEGRAPPRGTLATDRRSLVVELLPAEAPLTVAAFLSLVERRYFDGARWHRVVPNFVAQDGDPRGDGWGGPGFVLRDEVNPTRYETGTMGMALSGPDTGGSQFFITHSAQPHLDGTYTVFGRVVVGLNVLAGVAQGDRIRSIHR